MKIIDETFPCFVFFVYFYTIIKIHVFDKILRIYLTTNIMGLIGAKITITETGQTFEYGLPFEYKGVTYAIDLNRTLIAIEQQFNSGEWAGEEIYAITEKIEELFIIEFYEI